MHVRFKDILIYLSHKLWVLIAHSVHKFLKCEICKIKFLSFKETKGGLDRYLSKNLSGLSVHMGIQGCSSISILEVVGFYFLIQCLIVGLQRL